MTKTDVEKVIEREPFRPFTLRLSNGASYTVTDRRDIGAARNYSTIFYFGKDDWAMIDRDSIVEIIGANNREQQ